MGEILKRRDFLQMTVAGGAMGMWGSGWAAAAPGAAATTLVSPGCRKSKVKVARLFIGSVKGGWPLPDPNLEEEVRSYRGVFDAMKDQFADVEFVADQLVTSPAQIEPLKAALAAADGILVIHLSIGTGAILDQILRAGRPTMFFAVPYSGHEWSGFGALQKDPRGALFDCMLTSDRKQLAAAVRPFRALHHLREAKILDVTTRLPKPYVEQLRAKFGTEVKQVELQQVVDAYQAVGDAEAKAEADRWLAGATQVVEPSREDVFKSCRLALAFERMLADAQATVLTVDCYGTMWDKTIRLPAYPCLGFSRLNSLGLGGICESDLRSAMTHIILQGLTGRPGFISDPTMDESLGGIILAHCMGTRNMDGPGGPAAPYKLRTVMERRQGVVPQVAMRVGEKVTQAILVRTDQIVYFTGQIIDAPDVERGCRTKITVKIDGDAERLWKNWSQGLHRVTCYGDVRKDLARFCRFAGLRLVDEAA